MHRCAHRRRTIAILLCLLIAVPLLAGGAAAQTAAADTTAAGTSLILSVAAADGMQGLDVALRIVVLMTLISLAPALLVTLTCFTRVTIVLGFLRQAIGTNQAPANQILLGLAFFLTVVIMAPVLTRVNAEALQPLLAGEISETAALAAAEGPLKEFMLKQTREKDIALMLELTGREIPDVPQSLPMLVVVPSFVISELKTAFQMGFVLFIPFLIIDMVVASVLMSMGMMMLPPVLISLPFKVLLFVLVDGWWLVVRSLVSSFQ
ncbi:MAG: flagellar type III secretion system pore protein FliP [Candidatus Krumholzibacteria bacterium]|jgi:flagellar biosynthetic protein FliP|nr:flagellar type III secretion system pore protein FliP [Candidatus Krumholzibacteria bacterium]